MPTCHHVDEGGCKLGNSQCTRHGHDNLLVFVLSVGRIGGRFVGEDVKGHSCGETLAWNNLPMDIGLAGFECC
jgi:hypothetical protein